MSNVGDTVWVKCGINGDYEELAVIQNAIKKKVVTVKYIVSGIQEEADRESIRPMEDSTMIADDDTHANGQAGRRRVRRSTRTSSTPANVTPTPTPTEIDSDAIMSTKSTTGSKKVKGEKKRKDTTAAAAETASKKKAKGKVESPFFKEKEVEKKSPYFDDKAVKEKKGAAKGRKLILADDDVEETPVIAKKPGVDRMEVEPVAAKKSAAQKKPAATKKRKTFSPPIDGTANGIQCQPCGNAPDGNGGLNQPAPFIVEYSKTGRATCRTCDEKIPKGGLRVGHTPLFRGKPGYMVFRHLHCTVFSEEIVCAEDVENYADLTDEDYVLLVNQVETSKVKIKEELEDISPDELVQKAFQGEIRAEPSGLMANLLPFQIEGFSWMRHQEVEEPEIRGGILADEMG